MMRPAATLTYHDFLQTALIVDDEAFYDEDQFDREEATLGDESLEEYLAEPLPEAVEVSDSSNELTFENTYLRTREVIEGFADAGINCAALAPDGPSERDLERTTKLARRSDIVILDWLLQRPDSMGDISGYGNTTGTSLELIQLMLSEDEVLGQRVRLICIYTATPNLISIVQTLTKNIVNGSGLDFKVEPGHLRIHNSNTMILIIPKAHHTEPGDAVPCKEADLPGRLIREFEDFVADGLLPRLALASVAAIRAHTHRVLARFGSELDPAFISHRALTSSFDAEQFALQLVGDELSALINTAGAGGAVSRPKVEERVAQLLPNDDSEVCFLNGTKLKKLHAVDARKIALEGPDLVGKVQIANDMVNLQVFSLTSLLYPVADALNLADSVDDRFDMLSCLERSCEYDGSLLPAPIMRRGVVLADPQSNYWLCLQPLCDCIRLDAPTRYPFLPLTKPTANRPSFEFIVRDGTACMHLSAGGARFGDVRFKTFIPDPVARLVKATWRASTDSWSFSDECTVEYRWLGDLRADLAQRTAVEIATNVGRLGLEVAEHLRRNAKQS